MTLRLPKSFGVDWHGYERVHIPVTEMKNQALKKAIEACADPERARRLVDGLAAAGAGGAVESMSAGGARILAAVASGSLALGNLILAHPDWLEGLEPGRLEYPRRAQGFRNEVEAWLGQSLAARDYATALTRVREFKQREMLRIAARDLARLGGLVEIMREISDVADVCLSAVWRVCWARAVERSGQPWHQDADGRWQPTQFCVLGMGKLGGQELNYSSDVDVLFVYSEEGRVFKEPPGKGRLPPATLNNHQFFNRLGEALIAEVALVSAEGALFRIDLRLRPEGESGPLSRSLASYENYYAQWGQTWERMMLMKTRCVAGHDSLGSEFLETIQPFRYPRTIDQDALREIGAMKDRIENEVLRADELERNVKLGRGGIREVEFLVQAEQLLHAGRQPFLQTSQTLPALDKLAQYGLLTSEESGALRDAYCFLRDVEHRLQMDENLQTHTIPVSPPARARLARLMGFESASAFEAARASHTARVRRAFDRRLKSDAGPPERDRLPPEFAGAEEPWKQLLAAHSFRDVDKAYQVLREFVEGPGYVHVSARTVELARKLAPRLLALCPPRTAALPAPGSDSRAPSSEYRLSDPDRVVTRLDSFITAYGARSVLFELWNSNPAIFELLLRLFDRSEFLAELAIRTPDMVDELVTSGRLRQRKTAEETLRDLRHGREDQDQKLWLRRYHQTELMRIGLRDILGLADFEQYLHELSALADACLRYALEMVLRRHRLRTAPFVIMGLGKLGGLEIDYGSDLDIIFVAGARPGHLPKLQRIAVEIMDLVSDRTEAGTVFHTDARLRPDGEKGLLVNTLDAYEDYYRKRAQLWEIQSLTRTRPVAGDLRLGDQFQQLAAALTDFRPQNVASGFSLHSTVSAGGGAARGSKPSGPVQGLAAYSPDWKRRIHEMRMRIERERTPAGQDELAIKTGAGGLMDAEFIAQALCLEQGWQEANTLRALERGREAGAFPNAETLIANYRKVRRVEGILRRWSYEGETVLPDDAPAYYRVSVRCGFPTPDAFRAALAQWRQAIRGVYTKAFQAIQAGSAKRRK